MTQKSVTNENGETETVQVTASVYGGGYGENTEITGNTDVNIDNSQIGNVYGGGNAGIVGENTDIVVNTSTITDSIYGGGKAANVNGTTTIDVENSTANEVYGGGEDGQVTNTLVTTDNSATSVKINDSVINNVYGGGKGETATVKGNTNTEIISTNSLTTINDSVYGGGNAGQVEKNAVVTVTKSKITNAVYGGGNQAGVNGLTSVNIEDSTANEVYGGGNQGEVGATTTIFVIRTDIEDSVYGGGNQGEVKGNTTVTISNQKPTNPTDPDDSSNTTDIPEVKNAVFGGGKSANVNGTTVNLIENAKTQNVFGGGDQGEVIQNTNVKIINSTITNFVFGGGNGANTGIDGKSPGKVGGSTNVDISATEKNIQNNTYSTANSVFGGGKGITAFVQGNTKVILRNGSEIAKDVYGGGDNGYVNGSTNVELKSSVVHGSVYAAGNGEKAVVFADSHVYSEGTTQIDKNLFGGGNAAETGKSGTKTSKSIVDIAGLEIKGHIFGGANSSSVNGDTITNIGIKAIDTYYGVEKGYSQGNINIAGTIYGGGYSMSENSNVWDDTAISVTNTITINVFGDNYDIPDNDGNEFVLNIGGSIFGSGNASNAAQDGNVLIKNWGTEQKRKNLVSIQRSSITTIEKSVIILSGVKDSTSNYKETLFTFNKIGNLKLKNSSTLYLKHGTNRLSEFNSLNEDGTYATVEISTDFTTIASSDNRIYVANGKNFNICYGDPQKYEVGPVKGMTFFGIFKSTSEGDAFDPDGIYKGIYDQDYVTGGTIDSYTSRDFMRSYAYGKHTKTPEEQDITKDGFYTNMEALDEGYSYDNIQPDNFSAKSYTAYIDPIPKGDYSYYYWYAGPDQETYTYDIELVASKFATMGAVEVPLFSDKNIPGATLTMNSVDSSGLSNKNIELVSKNEIKNINEDGDANTKFGLSMKTGNTGWSNRGSAEFYKNTYVGDDIYQFENSDTATPSMSFFLYHSNNITENQNLGTYQILMYLTYWTEDGLNTKSAKVYFNITLFTKKYEGIGYNTAITPGMQYDLFTGTQTNITTKSSFSAYFEMGEEDFFASLDKIVKESGVELPENYYEQSYRVISTGKYVFPENTTITMIDRYNNENPEYYYYNVSKDDENEGKTIFELAQFLKMGSTDEKYDETKMKEKYYITDEKYQYESFIFIVNFEGADFSKYADEEKITPDRNYFEMFLRVKFDKNGEEGTFDLAKIINDQKDTTEYNIYKSDSTIGVEASLSKNKFYLGNEVYLNVKTSYDASTKTAKVLDTRYFDKKLGVKLTFYYKGENGEYTPVSGGTILGTYFGLKKNNKDDNYYYPRADGTTRIKIAELVSNSSSAISIITKNSTLTGEYKILVESFGSADGIYFGIEASASDTVEMEIVDDEYGLKSTLDQDRQAIIDSETGQVADSEGYTSEIQYNEKLQVDETGNTVTTKEEVLDNKIKFLLEYQSGLSNPYITVSLYRRNYDSEDSANPDLYDRTYSLVDLKDYVKNDLIIPEQILSNYDESDSEENKFISSFKKLEKEYEAVNTEKIKANVSKDTSSITFKDLEYELKKKLKTGTYKVVFKLYDTTDITAKREIKNAEGDITLTKYYNIRQYEEIGDTFSYIIIK